MVRFDQKMVNNINEFNISVFMTREKVYLAYFNSREKLLYYNQLKELTGLSYSSLQNVLKKMLDAEEIVKIKTKSNVYYKLTYLKPIEFSKISINLLKELNRNIRIPVKEFVEQLPMHIHSAALFGSASKKQEKTNSDIDILIILENFENKELQKKYQEEVKKIISKINIISIYPLSIAYTNIETFRKQEDYLLKEVKNTGFPILNQQKYFEAINDK